LLILTFIPLFTYAVYPAIHRVFPLTPLRKVSIGFFLTMAAFAVTAWVETHITGGEVVSVTSAGDVGRWPVENLLDGEADGRGWVSDKAPKFPQEIVVRLRERRPWTIESVRIDPNTDLAAFLKWHDENGEARYKEQSARCRAKDVEVLVGPSRKGPWTAVCRLELDRDGSPAGSGFSPVRTEYVMLRIDSNWGGDYVALGEIEVNDAGTAPLEPDSYAREVWPNVAAISHKPSIAWQLLAYVLMTAAEIMVSITCLEFSYTQAPNKMKSFIMSLYMLSVSAGNAFTALVNAFIQNPDGSAKLEGADYYWFFTAVIAAAAFAFIFVARNYRGRTYIQGEERSDSAQPKGESNLIEDSL
jgi:hypothetical protein